MLQTLRNILQEPMLSGVAMDSTARVEAHRAIIERKALTRSVFGEMQGLMLALEDRYTSGPGLRIELGAGAWPLKERDPEILATDLVDAPHLDRTLDAQSMDLADKSVRTFFAQHVFHHFPEPRRFLREVNRTLSDKGAVILIEPYWSPFARFVFTRLFTSESYDPQQENWENPDNTAMLNANQALSYIVFQRDRKNFENEFPGLRIAHHQPLDNWIRYLMSGGVNFRQMVPNFMDRPLRGAEYALRPALGRSALHHVVVLARNT
ncbi:methyltransferase domain-containing protein [Aurantimonas sp. E1-2-R+4]|uniref:class I SAM-dependent methyltransferase n=1 Tax=Aurantimonas sp. E1-2-R+4 TaxID=3113714 RepID=UPI002F93DE6F